MKGKDILDAMNNIDKKFINEAYPSKGVITMEKNNLSKSKKFMIPIAACMAVVAVSTILISTQVGKNENNALTDIPESTIGEVTTSVTDVVAETTETTETTDAVVTAVTSGINWFGGNSALSDDKRAELESELQTLEAELAELERKLKIEDDKILALTAGIDNINQLNEAQKAELEGYQAADIEIKLKMEEVLYYKRIAEDKLNALYTLPAEVSVVDDSKCIPTIYSSFEEGDNDIIFNDVSDSDTDLIFSQIKEEFSKLKNEESLSAPEKEWDYRNPDEKAAIIDYYGQDIFAKVPSGGIELLSQHDIDVSFRVYSPTDEYPEGYDNNYLFYQDEVEEGTLFVEVSKVGGPFIKYKDDFANFVPSVINGYSCILYSNLSTVEKTGTYWGGLRSFSAYFVKDGVTYHISSKDMYQPEFLDLVKGYLS